MTINELLSETYALGFSDEPELTDGFIFSANRALFRIMTELAEDSVREIGIAPLPIVGYVKEYTRRANESFSFDLKGSSYSFTASGSGSYIHKSKTKEETFSFSGAHTVCRGFCEPNDELIFPSDGCFTVFDLACFEGTDASREADIPLVSSRRRIDLAMLIPDLFRVTAPPRDENGNEIEGASALGSSLYVPNAYCGKIILTYRRRAARIDKNYPDGDIDIPKELEALLPILTASYLWLDDDYERSSFYLDLYRSEAARIRSAFPLGIGESYTIVGGWA
ncbi:MAG: hypothetical protein IJY18_05560 [Clostridia bacterium]|nr:hypothetical protein [Clostridia bacterium]